MNFSSTFFRATTFVLAGFGQLTLTSTAAPVPNPVTGDIFLAFRASGGEGTGDSYILNLGTDSVFRNAAAGSSFTISGLGNIAADLTAQYGVGWHTREDLFWGIFGHRTSPSSIVYGSRERAPVTSDSTAWSALDLLGRNSTDSKIATVLDGIGGYRSRQATANSAVATFQPNPEPDEALYRTQVGTPRTSNFGSVSGWSSIEGDFGGGTSGTALDLFRVAGQGVTRVGKFTINAAGTVTFTAPSGTPSNVDTDGDGYSDSEEAIAGTSPTNGSDFFQVKSLTTSAGAVGVSFNTVSARTYKVLYSVNLSGSWQEIHSVAGGTSPYIFTDSDPVRTARPKGFYKVSVTR